MPQNSAIVVIHVHVTLDLVSQTCQIWILVFINSCVIIKYISFNSDARDSIKIIDDPIFPMDISSTQTENTNSFYYQNITWGNLNKYIFTKPYQTYPVSPCSQWTLQWVWFFRIHWLRLAAHWGRRRRQTPSGSLFWSVREKWLNLKSQ